MATPEDVKKRADQACEAGEQFYKLFYETLDKRRHAVSKLYLESATLNWNGTRVTGQAEILKFLDNLPASLHTVECLDTQPIPDAATGGQTTILVTTAGMVKFDDNPLKTFNQNFMLTTQNNNWKIVTDCIRTAE